MSFVYIDSQGREVNIPSVDAVRLRIELGAIKDQTRFLDENTGKWAPAAEHEIYRTLKRQLMEAEQGFVAPPPPSTSADIRSSDGELPEAEPVVEDVAVEEASVQAAPDGESADDDAPQAVEPLKDADGADGDGAEADPAETDTAAADAGPADAAGADVMAEVDGLLGQSDGGWDLQEDEAFEVAADAPAEVPIAEDAPGTPPEFEGLGNVDLILPDEEPEEAEPEAEATEAEDGLDLDDPWGDDAESEEEGATPEGEASAEGEGAGEESEASLFVTSVEDELMGGLDPDAGAAEVDGGGLDLEPSLSESFPRPGESPASGVVEPDVPPVSKDDFGSVWESTEDHQEAVEPSFGETEPPSTDLHDAPAPEAPRRGSGAAPPQRKLTKARTPGAERIVGIVVLVLALGAAGVFGWRFVSPALSGGGSGEPEIVLPPLDQELLPRMRQLAGRASGRMTEDMLGLPERGAVPGEPSQDWLAGIYLAGASGYPNVPDYWGAIGEWVAAARGAENALFREALQAQLDTANLAASDAEAIRDRALAGFQAARADRLIVYEQMEEVSERALILHEFLLANEDQVDYEPAGSGVSRDPVLEAVPATEALGDEMWEMVGSITNAMDALGYLDRIDTERLLAVFLEKLEAVAIR